jgi:hypothetical protein
MSPTSSQTNPKKAKKDGLDQQDQVAGLLYQAGQEQWKFYPGTVKGQEALRQSEP